MPGLIADNVKHHHSFACLQAFFHGEKTPVNALDAFCEPIENKWMTTQDSGEVEEELNMSWRGLLSQAMNTSFKDPARQKLVDFVHSLRKRPNLAKDGQVCEVQGMTVWRDLPTFGYKVRDAWNTPAGQNSDQHSKDHWINLNAFTAALLASDPNDSLDLSLFGLWSTRMALEESHKAPDAVVAAAAAWFAFAGPSIWKFSQQGKSFDGKVAKPGSAFSEREWRGFSQERWIAWQDKFGAVEGQLSEASAKELVAEARKAMAEAK
ncbi:Hypothetical predicted protein [Lecanosticta acicola]|uniref:Uncharacterized protein n=1 Tax=Lecanosticta acicola TaxID=111012 RepID=A0AAI8Z0N4_9PEZI|nr:Hypothetical predicted protein [Lecanosticta acicola]